jgi:lipid II:glycine glycyltransferase (peptidoglycan interpeptide bridge formation enzyme)
MNLREIDISERDQWNNFVKDAPSGHICQSYEWGEVMSAFGWEAIRLVLEEKASFKAVISLLKKKKLGGVSYLYAPRGPIITQEQGDKALDYLLDDLKRISRKQKAVALRLNPEILNPSSVEAFLINKGFKETPLIDLYKCTFFLDLSKSIEELWANLEYRTKYAIKKATKDNIEVVSGNGREILVQFYQLSQDMAKRKEMLAVPFDFLEKIWNKFSPGENAKIFLALYQGQPIGGAFILRFGVKCWYKWGASIKAGPGLTPNEAIQWEVIQWAKKQGCRLYDLQGCSCEPDTQDGVTLFKRGFGGNFISLIGEYEYGYSPALYWFWNNIWLKRIG